MSRSFPSCENLKTLLTLNNTFQKFSSYVHILKWAYSGTFQLADESTL